MPRILIVDDDRWIQKMVSTILVKRGHLVETALDGEEGLAKAIATPPDLIISDVMMPKVDGWAFVKAVRSRPALALTPVIFLTALTGDNDRLRGFRFGADDFLPKPFRFEDLAARVTTALGKRKAIAAEVGEAMRTGVGALDGANSARTDAPGQSAEPEPSAQAVLHGSLDHIGLSTLLVILEMEQKTGVLLLQRRGEVGRLALRRGSVVRAALDRASDVEVPGHTGAEAAYELLSWAEGRFDFAAGPVDDDDQIRASTTFLLMEAARRIDEAGREPGRSNG